jgi:peptide/nickel transport system substrate-binding protein
VNISLSYQQEGFWATWFGSSSAINVGKYTSQAVDQDFAQAKQTLGSDARGDIYADAAAQLTRDAPWLFVVNDRNPRALSPKVKGFVMAQSWFVDLTTAYVEK